VKHYPDVFEEGGAHGHAYRLLADAALGEGVVLDLGCAAGPLAEQVTALGHSYVGADIDGAAIDRLRARGFEGHELDLALGTDELVTALDAILEGRPLAAVLLLDVIEHVADVAPLLAAVARLAQAHDGLQLVVSIPNVTHVDMGIKLLLGRWDTTDIGLLDDTHVRFFNGPLVGSTLAAAGWVEVDANDVVNAFSDQLFPADAPALRPGAPLRQLLWRIRMAADPYGETYQFVRRYAYDPVAAAAVPADAGRHADTDDVFLSVVVRAPGSEADGPSATDAVGGLLADLGRQSRAGVEVLVSGAGEPSTMTVPPRLDGVVRVVDAAPETDWRDAAMAACRGRYVALLDGRTRLSSRYVETVHRAVDALPGRVVQLSLATTPAAVGDSASEIDIEALEPVDLDPLELVGSKPLGSVALDAYAVPRHVWATNGLRFDSDAGDAGSTLFVLRAVELCGIVRSRDRVGAVDPSVPRALAIDLDMLQKQLSLAPLVVPEGAGAQLLALRQAVASDLPEQLAAAHAQVASLSWNLRRRDVELAEEREAARALRARHERRLTTRVRRQLGRLARRVSS
jgi:hypothetical protein